MYVDLYVLNVSLGFRFTCSFWRVFMYFSFTFFSTWCVRFCNLLSYLFTSLFFLRWGRLGPHCIWQRTSFLLHPEIFHSLWVGLFFVHGAPSLLVDWFSRFILLLTIILQKKFLSKAWQDWFTVFAGLIWHL